MKTSNAMMNVTSASLLPDRKCLRPLAGLALVGLLSVGCDGGGRSPTAPLPADFNASFSRSLTMVSGDGQQGKVNDRLPRPLAVRVTDSQGLIEAGATVLFRVIAGGGEIPGERLLVDGEPGEATAAVTDGAGIARVFLILGPQPGRNLVEAKVFFGGSDRVLFSASATP